MNIPAIPFLKNCTSFEFIDEGYSNDEKWCVDDKFLLRISPDSKSSHLIMQALLTNKVHAIDSHIPSVHDVGMHNNCAYVILDYLPGENGNIALPKRSEMVQYQIGQQVGRTLRNIHRIPAPDEYPSWESRWMDRVKNLVPRYSEIALGNNKYEKVLDFVLENLHLIKGRPSYAQHYDFHPGNILVEGNNFTGLIDMQKIRYGDPVNEFYKMEYFNVPISQQYSRGIIDGYHDAKPIPKSFWELHRLYAAIHIISAEVWANEIALDQQDKFKRFTSFTLHQFNDFTQLIPQWYTAG